MSMLSTLCITGKLESVRQQIQGEWRYILPLTVLNRYQPRDNNLKLFLPLQLVFVVRYNVSLVTILLFITSEALASDCIVLIQKQD